MHLTKFCAGLMVALAVSAIPANAAPIVPNAEIAGSLCDPLTTTCTHVLSTTGTVTSGSSYLTVGATPIPSVTAYVTGGAQVGWGDPLPTTGFFRSVPSTLAGRSGGYSGIQYYAMVVGPSGVVLPMDLAYSLTLTVSGGTRGAAWVGFNMSAYPSSSPPLRQLSTGAGSTDGKTTGGVTNMTVSGVLTDMIMSNTVFEIADMVQLNNSLGGTGYAFVDPALFIDPSFAAVDPDYLSHYSIVLSAGVGNDTIPEPATCALFTAGVVGIAMVRRRKKQKLHSGS